MTEAMKITLSTQPADARWGEKATYSINNDGITLHLNGADDLGLIQRAARKIDGLGIKHVQLSGEGWDADRCWAFWQGYKAPKGTRKVVWPDLDDAQRQELSFPIEARPAETPLRGMDLGKARQAGEQIGAATQHPLELLGGARGDL